MGQARETLDVHLAIDRRMAIAEGRSPSATEVGSVLFADVASFSRMTSELLEANGERRGVEELTHALDGIYDALIEPVHRYGGSVVTFSGDAITCVFGGDDGLAAATSAEEMHANVTARAVTVGAETRRVAIKIGLAHGLVHRIAPGDPELQCIDTLAGAPVLEAAAAERRARRGETRPSWPLPRWPRSRGARSWGALARAGSPSSSV